MKNIELEKQKDCVQILSLKEVGDRINRKDKESIIKTLGDIGVTIHRLANLIFVYEVDFDCAMILPQVKEFKQNFPSEWESYFRKTIKDEALFNLIMLKLKVEVNYKPTTKVKRSKNDDKLYNQLIS
jgi:hypothetical protein